MEPSTNGAATLEPPRDRTLAPPRARLHRRESERVEALHRLGLLDTPPEERFDRLARIAAASFGTPIALISLVDEERVWCKSRIGDVAPETPRQRTFCADAIVTSGDGLFVVNDAASDPRFTDHPLVTNGSPTRFYAGAVIREPGGLAVGTICVIDHQARTITPEQTRLLHDLAGLVDEELARSGDDVDAPPSSAVLPQRRAVAERVQADDDALADLEAALQRNATVARLALDSLEHGVVLADASGGIHQINPAAERILGFTGPELTERFRSGRWVLYDEFGEPLPPARRPNNRALTHGTSVSGAIVGWPHPDGRLVLLRMSSIPIPPGDNGLARVVVGVSDVTEQRRASRLLDATMATLPVGIAVVDGDGSIIRSNPTFAAHVGAPEEIGEGHDISAWIDDPVDRSPTGGSATEHVIETPGRPPVWLETRRAPIAGLDDPMSIVATVDVTERKQLELDLERFSHLFRHANDIITVVDAQGQVLYASPSNERVLGYPDGWRSPGGVFDMLHPDDATAAIEEFEALVRADRPPESFTMRVRAYDGTWKHIETMGTNLMHEPSVRGIVLTSRDVTERQILSDELAHRATHDPLTDLPNRAVVADRLGAALARSQRERTPVGVCYIDLDGFKDVNDEVGHAAGDEILIEVGRRLTTAIRGSDLAARLGGDEFLVVLDLVAEPDNALDVAKRIQRQLTTPPLEVGEVVVGVSMGVTVSRPGDSPSSLLSRADEALYLAKAATEPIQFVPAPTSVTPIR